MTETELPAARKAMIDSQLRTSGVNEPFVLARMAAVAREDFVPAAQRPIAYIDRAVPLGGGAYLAAPLVHGRMLAEARPVATDTALVVDGGCGYLAALLRPLVGSLDTIPAEQAAQAKRGRKSYTLIVVDGAIEHLPDALVARLAEGGRIVTGLVERGVTRLATGRKVAGAATLQSLADIGMPVLHAFDRPKEWSF